MNANKLADAIEKSSHCGYNLDAAVILRQQQAEIEALRERIKYLESQVYGGTTK